MADAVFSVRIDEELKLKFIEMAQESNINNKEMMEMLVSQYELSKMRDGNLEVHNDIDELQRITKRMMDLYMNIIEKARLREIEIQNKELKENQIKDKKITELEEMIQELLEKGVEITELKDNIKQLKTEKSKIERKCDDLKEMNLFLKEKNVQYETIFSENIAKLESFNLVKEQLSVVTAALEDQKMITKSYEEKVQQKQKSCDQQIQKLTDELEKTKKQQEEQLSFMHEKQKFQLNQLTFEYKEKMQREMMALQQDYMEKINKITSEKEELITQLSELLINRG